MNANTNILQVAISKIIYLLIVNSFYTRRNIKCIFSKIDMLRCVITVRMIIDMDI